VIYHLFACLLGHTRQCGQEPTKRKAPDKSGNYSYFPKAPVLCLGAFFFDLWDFHNGTSCTPSFFFLLSQDFSLDKKSQVWLL
jgi:hypothetical protein